MFLQKKARLIQYGLLVDQKVMFASEKEYEPMLKIVTYANSFAMNMIDGSLSRIDHENDDGQSLVTLVRDTPLKSTGEHLFHVITGNEELLLPSFRDDILQKFIFGTMEGINISGVSKLYSDDPVKFLLLINGIVDEVESELSDLLDKEIANYTIVQGVKEAKDTSVHYIGISTIGGIPVVNHLYGTEFVSRFKLPAKETSPGEVLRDLLSAQLSAIIQSSKNLGAVLKDISIKYFQSRTRKYKELSITFFPLSEQFVLEVCYDGPRGEIEEFVEQSKPLLNQIINKPFKGNLEELALLESIFKSKK
ncbi:MAG: hypothetical protein ACFFCS_06040 [Candidatus Hodarchaeota archaeon]